MPYDQALADRVRRALAGVQGLSEKKMFGGVAFLVNGAMCVGVDKTDLIIRCAKDETESLLAKTGVRVFDLSGGRPMKGWLLVGAEATKTERGFKSWLDFALAGATKPQTANKPGTKRAPAKGRKSGTSAKKG